MALLRETVVVELGDRHLDDLLTIADPLVVTDLPTLLWSPHGHHEIVAELLPLAQAVLVDSVEEPVAAGGADAGVRAERARLRRRPRLAALDAVARASRGDLRPAVAAPRAVHDQRRDGAPPPRLDGRRDAARRLARLAAAAGATGSLVSDGGALVGAAQAQDNDVALRLQAAPELQVPGLESLELDTASGMRLRLSRGRGGLRAH